MAELYIGTSGYHYPKDWKGVFYPDDVKVKDFLEYYSTQFRSLELNGTYYNPPSPVQMESMKQRTGGRVKFAVKVYKDITHSPERGKEEIYYKQMIEDKSKLALLIDSHKKAMEPLQKEKLLLCTLLEFPQSFHYDDTERKYLDLVIKEFGDMPLALELRNTEWQKQQVYDGLTQRNVAWVITDNPALKDLPKLDWVTTSDMVYFRGNGRNKAMWYKGDATTRYEWLYSDDELQGFVEPIKTLLKHAKLVVIFMNNHAKGYAAINAKKLELLLR